MINEELNKNVDMQEQEQQYELSMEELQDMMGQSIINPIQMEIDNLCEIHFDEKEFQKGIKEISKVCGVITGLINVGISPNNALDYVINKETIEHNQKLNKDTINGNKEIAQVQQVQIQSQQL